MYYQKTPNDYIREHLVMVKKIASWMRQQYPSHIDLDDMIQNGMEGLVLAAQNYNPAHGKFEQYASVRIRGAILDALRQDDTLPRHMRDKVNQWLPLKEKSRAEILQILSWSEDELIDVELSSQWGSVSLDDDNGIVEILSIDGTPEQFTSNKQDLTLLVNLIDALPEREKIIVSLYYDEECSLKEIAAILDLTESRVSQLLKSSIAKLRDKIKK